MALKFVPITTDKDQMKPYLDDPFCLDVFLVYQEFYTKIPFQLPWVGYFALSDNGVVGVGGFKGAPKHNTIEIAYGTVPKMEGRGYASMICNQIIKIALAHDSRIVITARTLMEENASTTILKKNGFKYVGVVDDPDDGEVWEWQRSE